MKALIYFSKEYFIRLFIILVLAFLLMLVLDLAELVKTHKANLIPLTLERSLRTLVQLLPLLVLITTIITLQSLGKRGELVALESLGIAKSQLISFSLIIIVFLYLMALFVIEKIATKITEHNYSSFTRRDNVFFRIEEAEKNYFLLVKKIDLDHLNDISLWLLDKEYNLQRTLVAERGFFTGDELLLEVKQGWVQGKKSGKEILSIKTKMTNLLQNLVQPQAIDLFDLPDLITRRAAQGFSTINYERYFFNRISLFIPMMSMVLLGFKGGYQIIQRTRQEVFVTLFLGLVLFLLHDLLTIIFVAEGLSNFTSIFLARILSLSIVLLKK